MQIDVGRDDRRQMLQVTLQDRISRRAEMIERRLHIAGIQDR